MIYIVSGFVRSGTSMMMQALIAGGMGAAWSEKRNRLADRLADEHYHPNQAGLYEVSLNEYGQLGFPLQYQDKLIKVMLWGLDGLAVNSFGYRVLVMRRDVEEIRQSYEGFFGHQLRHPWFGEYEERLARAVAILKNRRDVLSVSELGYRSVVNDPLPCFRYLGWPIDAERAAAVIDPQQCRFRREKLTIGL